VAIPCPSCGREYDITLFQFGRTIQCTCGTRVGLEKRIGPPENRDADLRFLADAMLGGLARWLRFLGMDTAYDPGISDETLVTRSFQEDRRILTRDRGLLEEWTLSHVTLLESEGVEDQLSEVAQRFPLRGRIRLFSRCPLCNSPLEPLSPEEAEERVPPRVFECTDEFFQCPACRQVYWEGSHTARIRERLDRILGGKP